MKVIIRAVNKHDQDWLNGIFANEELMEDQPVEVNMLNLSVLPGFVAQINDEKVGVISYQVQKKQYDIIMLHSIRPGLGIGRALVNSVIMEANDAKCQKVTAVTKNGNAKAVQFYQGIGFTIANVRPGSAARGTARHVSQRTPGAHRPTHDEIELVFDLAGLQRGAPGR
jgi:GNAT superfamily N-acetyltransferase